MTSGPVSTRAAADSIADTTVRRPGDLAAKERRRRLRQLARSLAQLQALNRPDDLEPDDCAGLCGTLDREAREAYARRRTCPCREIR